MLIKCPECEMMISDKAIMCPHCGMPFKPNKISFQRKAKKRLPNGFGQISEIKNKNLRNPFRAMVTVGFNDVGRPICKPLSPKAYFETYNEAYQALMEFHKNGSVLPSNVTFEELYSEWSEIYYKDLESDAAVASYKAAWKYLTPMYKTKVREARIRDLKNIIETASKQTSSGSRQASSNTKKNIKTLLNLLYDYAIENEIIDKNYARSFSLSKAVTKEASAVEKEHLNFSPEEKLALQNAKGLEYVDMVLIQCLTGFRPQELITIETANVNINERTIIGGLKTTAGTNRVVPIHSAIYDLVLARFNKAVETSQKYLFGEMTVSKYRWEFNKIIKKLGLNPNHRPHDPRKDFITEAKRFGMDEYALKRIVGHSIQDITERVYTKRDIEWLRSEIEKIKIG